MPEAKRKLAAILSADVAGYSRLMGVDEEATVATLNDCRAIFKTRIAEHHGRVVDTAGDSVLAEFPSVVEAVRTAVEVQDALARRNEVLPKDRRMLFRIGVNVDDVIEQADGSIYGGGVNVAARLEALAEPSGICVSASAFERVKGKLDQGFEPMGTHEVKNIVEPVQVFRVTPRDAEMQSAGLRGANEPTHKAPLRRALARQTSAAVLGLAAATLVAVAAVAWWFGGRWRPEAPTPQYTLRQLTQDVGLTYQPTMSPDGEFIAYTSDRFGEGALDIWVQQESGATSIRLTNHQADDYEPSFSPNGERIVFRSERDGGGVYTVPTLGGDVRLVAKDGRRPRFSPDGSLIAYWTGDEHIQPCQVYVVGSTGGEPRQLLTDFFMARYPTWAIDGRHLLFQGIRSRETRPDWWVVNLESHATIRTGAYEGFETAGLDLLQLGLRLVPPGSFDASGKHIIFAGGSGAVSNLWRMPISMEHWTVTGEPIHLTTGSGLEQHPSSGGAGRVVFSSLQSNSDVWSQSIDANQARLRGEMSRLTQSASDDFGGFLSADGRGMVFESFRSGNRDIWFLDLETGTETNLTETPAQERSAAISPNGDEVAYTVLDSEERPIFVLATKAGVAREICADCGSPVHWSPDGDSLLYEGRSVPTAIGRIKISSGEISIAVKHPRYGLYDSRFSPRTDAGSAFTP